MPKGYQHVTRDQRSQIYAYKSMGLSLRDIAKNLDKNVSSISREISRNTGLRGYRINQADARSNERRSNASRTPKKLTDELKVEIDSKLLEEWSPEQISGRFKLDGNSISHESIYQYIWRDKRAGGQLYKHLRHSGKKYNKRSSGKAGRGCIPNRVDITLRPLIVEEKSRVGDWEGDTITSAHNYLRQWQRVFRSSRHCHGPKCTMFFRYSISFLGAWIKRTYKWFGTTIPTKIA